MHTETGGTFSPSVKNPNSTATGLIQFLEATAQGLGTTTAALAAMSAVDQLDYVQKYFQNVINKYGQITDVTDCYLAVFYPAAIGWTDIQQFPDNVYQLNKVFDYNGDGTLTKGDFENYVQAHYSLVGTDPTNSDLQQVTTFDNTNDNIVVISVAIVFVVCCVIIIILERKTRKK